MKVILYGAGWSVVLMCFFCFRDASLSLHLSLPPTLPPSLSRLPRAYLGVDDSLVTEARVSLCHGQVKVLSRGFLQVSIEVNTPSDLHLSHGLT